MSKQTLLIAAALIAFAAAPAKATTVITFDTLDGADNEAPQTYYAGGQGSQGSTGGPNLGVSFSDNAITGVLQGYAGANTNSANSPSGPNILYFASGSAATMNVAGGFNGALSFYYSAPFAGGAIDIWSGANGTGSLLATLALPTTPDSFDDAGCLYTDFCPYAPITIAFAGTGRSVDFSGTENQVAFDNISFNPAGGVPEPTTWALLTTGLGLLGATLRRRRHYLAA